MLGGVLLMKFDSIPSIRAIDKWGYVENEEKFYNFVEEFNIVGVHWSEPITLSATYFLRLLQEGASARARNFSKKGWQIEHDESSTDMQPFYTPLLDHGALWKLKNGQVICTAMPYGTRETVVDGFLAMIEKFPDFDSVKLEFLEDNYRYRPNGDFMIVIYSGSLHKVFDICHTDKKSKHKEIGNDSLKSKKYYVKSTVYTRQRCVSEYTKRRAHGICQLCGQPAPFNDKYGEPYLETHHVEWLAKGGMDSIKNTVALCPNCHKKMHILNQAEDMEKLMKVISEF